MEDKKKTTIYLPLEVALGLQRVADRNRRSFNNEVIVAIEHYIEQEETRMATDRRAGPHQGPYVGKQPRTRNADGTWRKKRSDAGTKRTTSTSTTKRATTTKRSK